MKTTKKILSLIYAVALITTSSAAFADVDKPVKYGEKYLCDIQTSDGKNYFLDLEWNTKAKSYSVVLPGKD